MHALSGGVTDLRRKARTFFLPVLACTLDAERDAFCRRGSQSHSKCNGRGTRAQVGEDFFEFAAQVLAGSPHLMQIS
jgi:hypothetical protein